MKTIVNKTTSIKFTPEGEFLKVSDLIKQSLNVVPEGGFTREDFKTRDRIEAYLGDGSNKEIKMEDADAISLKKIVQSIKWTFRHEDLSDFLDQIDSL